MRGGEIRHHFSKHLQPDKKAMQRILMEFVGALKQVIKQDFFVVDVALKQGLGEVALVRKMIEETTLGNAHGGDDFFNGCGRESLGKNGLFRHLKDALSLAADAVQR